MLTMTRADRIVAVTLGLMGAGTVYGAAAGAVAITVVLLIVGEPVDFAWAAGGAAEGAVLGALTAPLLSWLLLRTVPLGKMFVVCTIGTIIGGVLGSFLGAFVGCAIAAIALRCRVQQA